jgi:sigma-E factor negative regulatory protein RseA
MSKGKEKLKESLSALMDNEASEFEFRRILKEAEVNADLKLKWERFHMLSAAIRGELDNRINAGFTIMQGESGKSEEKRPDLLSRINAELDGIDRIEGSGTNSSTTNSLNQAERENAINSNQFGAFTGSFKRLGQGAIAASVADIVLIAGGSLNPSVPLGTELQLAEQSEIAEDNVPTFDDDYFPSEFSRVPQLNTEVAGTESTDEAARVRLRQAVFQEFVGEPQESLELPVNFNVIIEEE